MRVAETIFTQPRMRNRVLQLKLRAPLFCLSRSRRGDGEATVIVVFLSSLLFDMFPSCFMSMLEASYVLPIQTVSFSVKMYFLNNTVFVIWNWSAGVNKFN